MSATKGDYVQASEELVRVAIVRDEIEAELACGVLRGAGIKCMARITNIGFGSGGEVPSSGVGARELLVLASDHAAASELLGR